GERAAEVGWSSCTSPRARSSGPRLRSGVWVFANASSAASAETSSEYEMVPTIESVTPASGSAAGGELVRVTARGLAPLVEVRFGDARADVVGPRPEGALFVVDVRTPPG